MMFCPNCDNLLFPREKKLYCKVCNEEFNFEISRNYFKIKKIMEYDDKGIKPLIIRKPKRDRISADDRKASKDLFGIYEGS